MIVAFIGHRKIERTQELVKNFTQKIEELIEKEKAEVFLFGSDSEFNDFCYEIITKMKEKYKKIKRVFVRAEYEYIDKSYTEYLLSLYEDTFFPTEVHGAGSLSYIKRNQVMIDACDILISYYDKNYSPETRTKSGTKIAIDYANSKRKRIINLFV